MRSLLLVLLLALLSFLTSVYLKRQSLRTTTEEGKLWKREQTEKISIKKLGQKEEPWIQVVKRAERVRELCKEWGSKKSFPLKQVTIMDNTWLKQIMKSQHEFIQICVIG